MGLFDIFKPGWKKDANKAAETIRKSSSLMTVLKIHDECGFRGKDRAAVNAAVVDSLLRLGNKHPEAVEYLAYLAREGDTALLRCQAAGALIGRPGMKEILRDNIAAAYADPGIEFQENPEAWIDSIGDPEIIAKTLQSASGPADLRNKVISRITDQDLLADVVIRAKDETLAMQLMDSLRGNEDIYIRIAEQCRHPRCVKRAADQIKTREVLLKMIMSADDENIALAAMNRFDGSEDEYKTILRTNRFSSCRQKAVRRLGGVSADLIASVKKEDPKAAMELFEMANESELIDLADMGLTRAIVLLTELYPQKYFEKYQSRLPDAEKRKIVSRLAEQEPGKYADRFYDLLTEDAKRKIAVQLPYSELKKDPGKYIYFLPDPMKRDMIDSGALSQDILEKLAMEAYAGDALDSKNVAVKAYRRITNMERQERLLFNKEPKTFSGRKGIMEWRMQIIRDLSFNEEIMWRVIQNDGFPLELKKEAFKHISSPDKLEQIAMSDSPLALQAAEKLPKNKLSKLRNSKNAEAAKMGTSQYNRSRVSRADEKSLLETMEWEYKNSSDPDTYLKALERLETQDALCKALSSYISSAKRMGITKENKPWIPVGQKILERITDGAGLAKVCLEKGRTVDLIEINRLRELIHGTDEEKKFTEAASAMLMTDPANEWRIPAALLMKYYELPDAAHAAWRFGGPRFIQRLLNLLDAERESVKAKEIGSYIKYIYKQVPESHAMLSGQNGRRYVKHYDYYDSGCAGNNVDRSEDYVLTFTN